MRAAPGEGDGVPEGGEGLVKPLPARDPGGNGAEYAVS